MRMRFPVIAAALLSLIVIACKDSSGPDHGPPTQLLVTAGASQTGVFGQAAAVVPTVLVTDASNRPVPGVTVTFTLQSGGGSITNATATTNSAGNANPGAWILGKTFGAKTLTATIAGLTPVTFTANAIAPDAGVLAFNLTDPAADTLANPTGIASPKAHDLLSVRGDFKRDSLIVTFNFGGPVGPASAGGNAAILGRLEFDIDDNASTGRTPFSNGFGGSANIGVDYYIQLASSGSTVLIVSPTLSGTPVNASFSGNNLVVRIPILVLGNDDGNFTVVGVIGTIERPTDVIPNSGASTVRPAGATVSGSARYQLLPKPTSINRRPWPTAGIP